MKQITFLFSLIFVQSVLAQTTFHGNVARRMAGSIHLTPKPVKVFGSLKRKVLKMTYYMF